MANENKYQSLSQIDYCMRQYFSRYMAPALTNEVRSLRQKQSREFRDSWNQNASPFVPVNMQIRNADMQLKVNSTWYKKTSDDLISRCKAWWGKDAKFSKDYQTFLDSFYRELVRQNGGKGSEKLAAFAENYVARRFQDFILEQLAREKVPKNSATYIARKAMDDSFLGLLPKIGPKEGEHDSLIEKKAEDLYNPNMLEQGMAISGAMAIDAAMTGGYASGNSLLVKGATKAGIKVAPKTASFLNSAWSGATIDGSLRAGLAIGNNKGWQNEKYAKQDSKEIFHDEDAIKKIQTGSDAIRKANTEVMYQLNSQLERKIKTSAPTFSMYSRKEMDHFYASHKNQPEKLLSQIKADFSRQAIPFRENSQPASWMLKLDKKRLEQCASGFYAIAMEMSKRKREWINVAGRHMTFKEVSQRAFDYAQAAVILEKKHAAPKAVLQKDSWDENMRQLDDIINQTAIPASYTPQEGYVETCNNPAGIQDSGTQSGNQEQSSTLTKEMFSGWEDALDKVGLSGFSDVTKNMGYVLAMLPDMIIGMFTGKNPNLQLEDNLLPLSAIFGGMFVRNPLLKLLLVGFGGANLLNNAGHAALGIAKNTAVQNPTYKKYEEECLNPRISHPAIKGNSMIADVDGKPCVIGISETAIDAYEKGFLPLSTLANAVLRKYDENSALAAGEYERGIGQQEHLDQSKGIK